MLDVSPEWSRTRPLTASEQNVPYEIAVLLRNKKLILGPAALFLLLSVVYIINIPPTYTSEALLLIDNRRLELSRQDIVFAEAAVESAVVETQVEILRSRKIAQQVVQRLNLAEDVEFVGDTDAESWFRAGTRAARAAVQDLGAFFYPQASGETSSVDLQERQRRLAVATLTSRISAKRLAPSYVVEVQFTAGEPEKAARILDEITRVYLEDQAAASAEAAQSASAWLRERLKDLGPKARVISPALVPLQRSGTKGLLITGAATLAGALLGVGAAFAREVMQRKINSWDEAALNGVECFGAVPKLSKFEFRSRKGMGSRDSQILSASVRFPGSRLSHTLERVLVSLATSSDARQCLGVTSTMRGEGKTTIAANLARTIAISGKRILLVDADSHHPTLSRVLAPDCSGRLSRVLDREAPIDESVWMDNVTGMHFLAAETSATIRPSQEMVWLGKMSPLISDLRRSYDCIVFDLPALGPTAEVRAAAAQLDAFILVIEAGRISPAFLSNVLSISGPVQDKIIGTVLNKVAAGAFAQTDPLAAYYAGPAARRGAKRTEAFISHQNGGAGG